MAPSPVRQIGLYVRHGSHFWHPTNIDKVISWKKHKLHSRNQNTNPGVGRNHPLPLHPLLHRDSNPIHLWLWPTVCIQYTTHTHKNACETLGRHNTAGCQLCDVTLAAHISGWSRHVPPPSVSSRHACPSGLPKAGTEQHWGFTLVLYLTPQL